MSIASPRRQLILLEIYFWVIFELPQYIFLNWLALPNMYQRFGVHSEDSTGKALTSGLAISFLAFFCNSCSLVRVPILNTTISRRLIFPWRI
jgi:hypothetical protein